jgi:hypothetical protein
MADFSDDGSNEAQPEASADELLILAIAAGKTKRDAAAAAGVSERTVFRRLQDADFVQRVNRARADLFDRALGVTAEGMGEAAIKLRALLWAQAETVQLGAARALLEQGTRLRQAVDGGTATAARRDVPAEGDTMKNRIRQLEKAAVKISAQAGIASARDIFERIEELEQDPAALDEWFAKRFPDCEEHARTAAERMLLEAGQREDDNANA